MFGLTPRNLFPGTPKSIGPLPAKAQTERSSLDYKPNEDERRLAQELEKVLAQNQTTHRPTSHHNGSSQQQSEMPIAQVRTTADPQTQQQRKISTRTARSDMPNVYDSGDGPGFLWVVAEQANERKRNEKKLNRKLWLTRAERQSRRSNLHRGAQIIVLASAAIAIVMIAVWPTII